jgi:hypothetical protein
MIVCSALLAFSVESGHAFSFQGNKSNNNSKQGERKTPSAVSSNNLFPSRSRKNFIQIASAVAVGGASLVFFPRLSGASSAVDVGGKIRFGDESIMSPKEHGTSNKPVQSDLLYDVNNKLADKICNFNRHFAEMVSPYYSSFADLQMFIDGRYNFKYLFHLTILHVYFTSFV